jgi:hypothetical protein
MTPVLSGWELSVRIQAKLSQTAFQEAIFLARRELATQVSAIQSEARLHGMLSDRRVPGLQLPEAAKLNGMRLIG